MTSHRPLRLWLLAAALFTVASCRAQQVQELPTGVRITPNAAPGADFQLLNPHLADLPGFTADHPVSTAISPDGGTLLVLTSGYNHNRDANGTVISSQSNEYVFIYDVHRRAPVKRQVLLVPNTFVGLAWNPRGTEFYVSGGPDDCVHRFRLTEALWQEVAPCLALGHTAGLGIKQHPAVAGLAVDAAGARLLTANYANDSVSLIDLNSFTKVAELDLRPGKSDPAQKGIAGGEYPFGVAMAGDKAYVSSLRDREIVVVDLGATLRVSGRIKLRGQPNRLLLNRDGSLLFAALDNSDSVAVVDTHTQQVIADIGVAAPASVLRNPRGLRGANPNSLALAPDERTLYVTEGGTNAVAVVAVIPDARHARVVGLIPTGWYPNSASVSSDGTMLYVVNGKSVPGPNPLACRNTLTTPEKGKPNPCETAGQYILQLQKGGLLSLPVPDAATLRTLTDQVRQNNGFTSQITPDPPLFRLLRGKIHHVIYIVKENRTYDQVLGDLEKGNGDPDLTLFPEPLSPNHHQLARRFVTLDNFYDSGDVSGDGWNWSTAARATDLVEKTIPLNYAGRKLSYDVEGANRGVNVSVDSREKRTEMVPEYAEVSDADDLLPGTADVTAPDGPNDARGAGYLWDAALRAGLTVRNYGFYVDTERYVGPNAVPLLHDPAASSTRVAFPVNPALHAITDPYFRGFDQRFADYWRYKEWEREFDEYVRNDDLPALELVRFEHDHFGSFKDAEDGVNTVQAQMADNDYALGLLVEKIARSKYSQDTVIFVIEDDAQNGPDHVDAHRSLCLVIGAYVKQGALVSHRYNTVSVLRSIEALLGIASMGLNDALQPPMTAVFSPSFQPWDYSAYVPAALVNTKLPLPASAQVPPPVAGSLPDAAFWAQQTAGFDFDSEDRLDAERFNRILWHGMMGSRPYPLRRSRLDLRRQKHRR